MARCCDCRKVTFSYVRTGEYTNSYLCSDCQKKYEPKKIIVHNTITILVKKEKVEQ